MMTTNTTTTRPETIGEGGRATGPRTDEGKQRSRLNGLRHGLAAEVVVPEEDRQAYEEAIKRWDYEAGPANVVEKHLVKRAAVASVQLDRIEEARQQARETVARQAVVRWEKRHQAAARRLAEKLPADPANVVDDLESTVDASFRPTAASTWIARPGP